MRYLTIFVFFFFLPRYFGLAQQVYVVPDIDVQTEPYEDDPNTITITDPNKTDVPKGLSQALQSVGSLLVKESGGSGQMIRLSMRGSDPQATLGAVEGVTLNSPFLGGADLSGFVLLPLDEIEVMKGGYSARFGTDAIGGVVNARLINPLVFRGTRVTYSVGSFGTTHLKIIHSLGGKSIGGLGSIGILCSEGAFPFRDTNGNHRIRTHNGSLAMDGTLRFDVVRGFYSLMFFLNIFTDQREIPGFEQFPSMSASQRDNRVLMLARYIAPPAILTDGSTEITFWYKRMGFSYDDQNPPIGPKVSSRLISDSIGFEMSETFETSHYLRIMGGIGFQYDHGAAKRLYYKGYKPERIMLSGVGGAKIDIWKEKTWLNGYIRVEWDKGFGVNIIPKASIIFSPIRYIRCFGSVGRAFRLPTFEELHFDAGFVKGNPNLTPELALTWDAGIELANLTGFIAKATFFESYIQNLILFLPKSAYVMSAENSGSAKIRGLETEVGFQKRGLETKGFFTWTDAIRKGQIMPHRPKYTFGFSIRYIFGPVRIGTRLYGQSKFYLDRFETLAEEGRVMVDANIEIKPDKVMSVAFDLYNILDKRDAVDYMQYPLPGRSFYATLRLHL